MSFGNEKLARLLSQHDIAYDDRLSVCKALADVSSNAQNASRIVASQELIQSMANILNSTSNTDIDNRHQVQVCLAITRCLVAGGDKASMAFTKAPGLIEGLCKLKRDPEPFVRVAAETSLRLLLRSNEACGVNRRLLRLKWQNVLDVDPKTATAQNLLASPQTAQRERCEEVRRDQRLVKSATSAHHSTAKVQAGVEAELSKHAVYASALQGHDDNWTSSRTTEEHNNQSLHSSALSESSSISDRNGLSQLRGMPSPSRGLGAFSGMHSEPKNGMTSSPLMSSRPSPSSVRRGILSPA